MIRRFELGEEARALKAVKTRAVLSSGGEGAGQSKLWSFELEGDRLQQLGSPLEAPAGSVGFLESFDLSERDLIVTCWGDAASEGVASGAAYVYPWQEGEVPWGEPIVIRAPADPEYSSRITRASFIGADWLHIVTVRDPWVETSHLYRRTEEGLWTFAHTFTSPAPEYASHWMTRAHTLLVESGYAFLSGWGSGANLFIFRMDELGENPVFLEHVGMRGPLSAVVEGRLWGFNHPTGPYGSAFSFLWHEDETFSDGGVRSLGNTFQTPSHSGSYFLGRREGASSATAALGVFRLMGNGDFTGLRWIKPQPGQVASYRSFGDGFATTDSHVFVASTLADGRIEMATFAHRGDLRIGPGWICALDGSPQASVFVVMGGALSVAEKRIPSPDAPSLGRPAHLECACLFADLVGRQHRRRQPDRTLLHRSSRKRRVSLHAIGGNRRRMNLMDDTPFPQKTRLRGSLGQAVPRGLFKPKDFAVNGLSIIFLFVSVVSLQADFTARVVSNDMIAPFVYTGRVSIAGRSGSGAVVGSEFVMTTAAHFIFNEADNTWFSGMAWLWRNENWNGDEWSSEVVIRSLRHFGSYADAVQLNGTNDPAAFAEDFAAGLAFESLTNGNGYGTPLSDPAMALANTHAKQIVGFPQGLYPNDHLDRSRMHTTGVFTSPFERVLGEYYFIEQVSMGPGASGGGTWIKEDGQWHWAAVYVSGLETSLGGSDNLAGVVANAGSKASLLSDVIFEAAPHAPEVLAFPASPGGGLEEATLIEVTYRSFPMPEIVWYRRGADGIESEVSSVGSDEYGAHLDLLSTR